MTLTTTTTKKWSWDSTIYSSNFCTRTTCVSKQFVCQNVSNIISTIYYSSHQFYYRNHHHRPVAINSNIRRTCSSDCFATAVQQRPCLSYDIICVTKIKFPSSTHPPTYKIITPPYKKKTEPRSMNHARASQLNQHQAKIIVFALHRHHYPYYRRWLLVLTGFNCWYHRIEESGNN